MAADNNSTEDTRRRFNEAKQRWKSLNENDKNLGLASDEKQATNIDAKIGSLADFLERNTKSRPIDIVKPIPVKVVHSNDNIRSDINIPIPLPVRSLDEKTLEKSLDAIAHEHTLTKVADVLQEILINIKKFAQYVVDRFVDSVSNLHNSLPPNNVDTIKLPVDTKGFFNDNPETMGWGSKLVGNTINQIKKLMGSNPQTTDKLSAFFSILVEAGKKTVGYLKGIYDNISNLTVSDTQAARNDLDQQKLHPLAGFKQAVFEEGGAVDKAFKTISSLVGFFKKVGDYGASKLGGAGSNLMALLAGSGMTGLLSATTKFLAIFGGIGGFIATVVGSAIFASLYAMFKHPDQLVGMFEAFGNLFTKVIAPALTWIAKEVIPPLTVAFSGLLVAADYLLDTVGTYINKKLIWLIGTAIPDIAVFFGKQIDLIWQTLKEVVLRIGGVFGVGPYGDKDVIENISMIFVKMADSIFEFISIWATEVIKSLGLQDFFGLKKDEGIYGRIKRFFMEDIPNYAIALFDQMMKIIEEYNPIPYIEKKIKDFTDAIVNLIPSWNDVKQWALDSIPTWMPDSIKKWFEDQLSSQPSISSSAQSNNAAEATQKPIQRMLEAPIGMFDRQSSAPIVVAPTYNNNNSSQNISNNTTSGPGIGLTRPFIDSWADLTYKSGL